MNNTMSRGLKDTEAAKLLGLHPQTLRNMRCRGVVRVYYKLNKAVRYLAEDLIAYREARKIQTREG